MCVCAKKKKGTDEARKGKRERKKEKERFKADQYFIFERRCHDGNRYLKIEKYDAPPRARTFVRTEKSGWRMEVSTLNGRAAVRKEEESDFQRVERSRRRTGPAQRLVVTQV